MADITEELPIDLSGPGTAAVSDTSLAYDVAIESLGFFLANSPERQYIRQTAPFKKDQSDNSNEPGEQSLSGWWLRSQSSFHYGAGIKFYEPVQDEKLRFRFEDSYGVNVWEQGEVSLLNGVTQGHVVANSNPTVLQSIQYGGQNAILSLDGHDIDKISSTGAVTHFVDYNTGTEEPVYAMCNDGQYAYYLTNQSVPLKFHVFKKPLTGDATNTADIVQLGAAGDDRVVTGFMEWVKERVLLCVNNFIYTVNPVSGARTLVYQHPSTSIVFTGITQSSSNIYVSARDGLSSFILRLTLDVDGEIVPTLSGAVVAAEMPRGELIYTIKYYLGYMLIGTSFGARVAQVSDAGEMAYGPLVFHSTQPVYQFACDDSYAWCAAGVNNEVGLVRIDLATQIDTLRFAYANDLVADGVIADTTGVAFIGDTDLLCFTGAGKYHYVDSGVKRTSGWITTGRIRYNTLEPKIFKFISERAKYVGSSTLSISVIDATGYTTAVGSKTLSNGNTDSTIPLNVSAEFYQFKFTLGRNSSDTTTGTTLYGYQIKSLPASPRQRLIQYPLFNFDVETDRYNNRVGYDGRAYEILSALEALESIGDIVSVADYRTGEQFSALIEEVTFRAETPPDKRFTGSGGLLSVTVRKI